MPAHTYSHVLVCLIERLLSGEYTVARFYREYSDYYLDHRPDPTLSREEAELFAAVQQKLDWTEANPSPASRRDGWLDHEQFVAWARRRYQEYLLVTPSEQVA